MTEVLGHEGSSRDVQVIIGVDTHQDQHVAVALNRKVSVSTSVMCQPLRTVMQIGMVGPQLGRDSRIRDRRHWFLRCRSRSLPGRPGL